MKYYAAIDLGASSGRVAVGGVDNGKISFEIVHRFANTPILGSHGSVHWSWERLMGDVLAGLEIAASKYSITSVGVDAWAVDYLLFDREGLQSAPLYSYRDSRTDGVMDEVIRKFGRKEIYSRTGIQFLPFNSIYQFLSANRIGELDGAKNFLMLPDAINYMLCGSTSNEITNASTTQLLDPYTRSWNLDLVEKLGLPKELFPVLHEAKSILGVVDIPTNAKGVKVVAVGSHDTASAVAGTPLSTPESQIFISSGTWSLIGCEITEPITTEAAMNSNLTNELGVEGTVRLLKNVSGMWIISELLREWNSLGDSVTVDDIVKAASESPPRRTLFDPNDSRFMAPGPMSDRIARVAGESNQPVPEGRGQFARAVYESLALSYSRVIEELEIATGKVFTSICIVGGGSANHFLNQVTANVTGLKVQAGPVEATLMGNIGVQAMAEGEISSLAELRGIVASSDALKLFLPKDDT